MAFSDRSNILEILKDCKYILHAGDVNKDEILNVLRSMGNLYVVRGNNDKDWAENLRISLNFTIGGVKFFKQFTTRKDVTWDLDDTQVVIFGHTHKYRKRSLMIVCGLIREAAAEVALEVKLLWPL